VWIALIQAIDESIDFCPVMLASLWLALASALAEPLDSRGVVGIHYCSENLHIVPVFGANALTVSPRAGHIHVKVDDAAWVWADASGLPIILQGLLRGPHKLLIESVDAKRQPLEKGMVTFINPEKIASEKHQ
jgi:hypothetical protein